MGKCLVICLATGKKSLGINAGHIWNTTKATGSGAVILPTVLPVINFCYKNLVKPPLSPRQAVMESCSAEPRPSTPFKRKDYN